MQDSKTEKITILIVEINKKKNISIIKCKNIYFEKLLENFNTIHLIYFKELNFTLTKLLNVSFLSRNFTSFGNLIFFTFLFLFLFYCETDNFRHLSSTVKRSIFFRIEKIKTYFHDALRF